MLVKVPDEARTSSDSEVDIIAVQVTATAGIEVFG